jgi:hypothetical protein
MPHLRYCGQYFRVASDELWLPGFCSAFIRVSWTTILFIVTIIYSSFAKNCAHDIFLVFSYLTVSIALNLVCIGIEIAIIHFSVQGSPVDSKIRDMKLPRFLNWRVALGMISLPVSVFGFGTAFRYGSRHVDPSCEDPQLYELIVLFLVAFFQLMDATAVVCCCYVFSYSHNRPTPDEEDPIEVLLDTNDVSAAWSSKCKTMCKGIQLCTCNLFGGSHIGNEFDAIGKTLTALFHHEGFLDVVASDVIAGVILVRMEHTTPSPMDSAYGSYVDVEAPVVVPSIGSSAQSSSSHTSRSMSGLYAEDNRADDVEEEDDSDALLVSTAFRSPHSPRSDPYFYCRYPALLRTQKRLQLQSSFREDRQLIKDAAYYCSFATAIYSHLLAAYMHPVSAPCGICMHKATTFSRRRVCCCCIK